MWSVACPDSPNANLPPKRSQFSTLWPSQAHRYPGGAFHEEVTYSYLENVVEPRSRKGVKALRANLSPEAVVVKVGGRAPLFRTSRIRMRSA